jgi:hypothetical protein
MFVSCFVQNKKTSPQDEVYFFSFLSLKKTPLESHTIHPNQSTAKGMNSAKATIS